MKILIFSHEIYKAIWFDLIFLKLMDTRALSSSFYFLTYLNHRNMEEMYGFPHSNNIHLAKCTINMANGLEKFWLQTQFYSICKKYQWVRKKVPGFDMISINGSPKYSKTKIENQASFGEWHK